VGVLGVDRSRNVEKGGYGNHNREKEDKDT